MINVGITNRNARWKFCIAMASSRFDQLYTTKRLQLYDIALPRLTTEGRWTGRQHFNTFGVWWNVSGMIVKITKWPSVTINDIMVKLTCLFPAASVKALRLSYLFSRSIVSSVDRVTIAQRAWWITFDHRYALSPCTIITVLPLFYLTWRRIPGPPVFQRETLKSWEWAWGRGYLWI